MDWGDLRFFLAVAEEGSLRAAARRLEHSQPTVGRRVHALEDELGVALFDRLPGGHSLTAQGEALLPHARAMREAAEALDRQLAGKAGGISGSVRVAVGESVGNFLSSRVAELRDALPEIQWELAESHVVVSLSRREADIAVRDVRPETGDLFVSNHGRMRFAIYGSAAYVETHRARRRVALEECDWIGYEEEHRFLPSARWRDERTGQTPLRAGLLELRLDPACGSRRRRPGHPALFLGRRRSASAARGCADPRAGCGPVAGGPPRPAAPGLDSRGGGLPRRSLRPASARAGGLASPEAPLMDGRVPLTPVRPPRFARRPPPAR